MISWRVTLGELTWTFVLRPATSARKPNASKPSTTRNLIKRDKINLDIFWLKDESLEESANLPAPGVIAQDIMEDLQAALQQFATIAEDLKV